MPKKNDGTTMFLRVPVKVGISCDPKEKLEILSLEDILSSNRCTAQKREWLYFDCDPERREYGFLPVYITLLSEDFDKFMSLHPFDTSFMFLDLDRPIQKLYFCNNCVVKPCNEEIFQRFECSLDFRICPFNLLNLENAPQKCSFLKKFLAAEITETSFISVPTKEGSIKVKVQFFNF